MTTLDFDTAFKALTGMTKPDEGPFPWQQAEAEQHDREEGEEADIGDGRKRDRLTGDAEVEPCQVSRSVRSHAQPDACPGSAGRSAVADARRPEGNGDREQENRNEGERQEERLELGASPTGELPDQERGPICR